MREIDSTYHDKLDALAEAVELVIQKVQALEIEAASVNQVAEDSLKKVSYQISELDADLREIKPLVSEVVIEKEKAKAALRSEQIKSRALVIVAAVPLVLALWQSFDRSNKAIELSVQNQTMLRNLQESVQRMEEQVEAE